MTSLRQRYRQYRRAEEDFPPTPEDFECSVWRKLAGAATVMVVAFALTAPVGWMLVELAKWAVPNTLAAILGLGLLPLSMWVGHYVGAPVADHVFDIPREVSE